MSWIMGQIKSEHPQLFALEFGKIAEYDFVYTLASTNIDQSVLNLATIYIPIKSHMSSIMGQIESEHPESYLPLSLENMLNLTLFTLQHIYQY